MWTPITIGTGDEAPQFTVPALDGKTQLSLNSYRGKVVYLDFWASCCPPCLTKSTRHEASQHAFTRI